MPGKGKKRQQQLQEEGESGEAPKDAKRTRVEGDGEQRDPPTTDAKRQLDFGEDAMSATRNYWVLKSEPNIRMVNGVDVSYSIDQLMKEPNQVTCWDGVRNMEARNNLREMKIGDLAFFYHSNCRDPGLVGIVQVVSEAYPDPTQFEPASPYYDKVSGAENPRWDMVDVKFVRKLRRQILLAEMRGYQKEHEVHGGPLKSLAIVRRQRLSVQPLTKSEYDFLLQLESLKKEN